MGYQADWYPTIPLMISVSDKGRLSGVFLVQHEA